MEDQSQSDQLCSKLERIKLELQLEKEKLQERQEKVRQHQDQIEQVQKLTRKYEKKLLLLKDQIRVSKEPPKYPKRQGTVDAGKPFEELMCCAYALKLSLDPNVLEFEMTSNNAECESFDDIEFKVKLISGSKRFMFQLKHNDRSRVLKKKNFEAEKNKKKNDFLAEKYFESILKIKDEDAIYILYTNNKVDLEDNSTIEKDILAQKCKDFQYKELLLLDTTKRLDSIFEFTSSDKKSFYLLAHQFDVKAVENKLKKDLQDSLKCDIYGSLTHFMNKWWSQNNILTKHDFVAKLTELSFSPFIKCLSDTKINEKTNILKDAIMEFEMTIMENGEDVNNIWTTEKSENFNKWVKHFALTKNELLQSKLSWFLGKTPLIVKVDDVNKPTILSVLKVLKLERKKILLIGDVTKEDFEKQDVFEDLSDLLEKSPEIHQRVTNNFKISLQGRTAISLETLLSVDESVSKHIKTQHLLEMTKEDCYVVGKPSEKLPELHIPRNVGNSEKKEIFVEENEIFDRFKNQLNVFCAPPGMGKSRLFQVLYKNCPPDSWAILVNLINHNQFFVTRPTAETMLLELMEKEKEDCLVKEIKNILLERNRVEIFLDGLDEVDSAYLDLVMKYVQYLINRGLHVWLSSRENLRETIQQTLKVEPLEIQELQKEEQRYYIHEKLKTKYKCEEVEKIIDVVFRSVDVVNSQKLLGIPLQLHILTEIFLHTDNVYKELEKRNLFVLTRMYKLFFSGKKNFKNSKLGIDESLENQLGINFEHYLELYEIPALRSCLDRGDFERLKLKLTKSDSFLQHLKTEGDKHAIIKTILTNDEFFEAVFDHQTFAEYFACVWLKKNRKKLVILKNSFFSVRYDNLRRIFDIMMAEDNPLHLAVIYQNIEEVQRNLDTRFDEKDEGGRRAFHLVCSYSGSSNILTKAYGLIELERVISCVEKMTEIFLQKCKDIYQRDDLFHFDYLDYSLNRGSLHLMEKLAEKKMLTFEEIEVIIKRSQNDIELTHLVIFCAGFGYHNLLTTLLSRKPDLAVTTLRFFNGTFTVLHAAIKGSEKDDCSKPRKGNIEAVKILADQIKDINEICQEETNLFCNPLDYACLHGCYDMFNILMAKGAQCSGSNTILHQIAQWRLIDENVIKQFEVNINAKNDKGETALHLACLAEKFENVTKLFEMGCDFGVVDNHQNTVLHATMKTIKDNVDITKFLVTIVDINAQNDKGKTALHIAVKHRHYDSAHRLLQNDVDLTIRDHKGNTVLHSAMQSRTENFTITKSLVAKGVDINAQNDNGETALHLALKNNFIESVNLLLKNDADLTLKDNNKNTLLHFVMTNDKDNVEITKILRNNVSVNEQNVRGETPLHLALKNGLVKNVNYLLEEGADHSICDKNGNNGLHFVMQNSRDNIKITEVLVTKGVSINAQNDEGETALHLAAKKHFSKSARYLVEKGADLTIVDCHKNTVLHCLMRNYEDCIEITELLLKKGVDINAQNDRGETALHLATQCQFFNSISHLIDKGANLAVQDNRGNTVWHFFMVPIAKIAVAKLLIKNGLYPNSPNNEGVTPTHLACKNNNLEIVEYLHNQNVDFTLLDHDENTALHFGSRNQFGNTKILDFLLNLGLNINARNRKGQTPLHVACENSCLDNVQFLCERNADLTITDNEGRNSVVYARRNEVKVPEFIEKERPKILRYLEGRGLKVDSS